MSTSWDERNAQKRLQEERAKLGISGPMAQSRPGGPMAQWITPETSRRSTSLSDRQPSQTPPLTTDVGPVGHRPATDPVDHRPKKDTRVRPHLDIRLPNGSLDVERIVANWTAEKKAAPNVAAAIRLMDAILTGNTDYVRENYPMLVEGLQKTSQRRATPPLKDSYKERESEEKSPEVELLATALFEATGSDPRLNPAVYDLATQLHQANYTADEVRRWYQKCWPNDWRGKKGDRPALKEVREQIGQVRLLPMEELLEAANPYLSDPFFARDTDSDPLPPVEDIPAWPPDGCNGGKAVLDPFLATLGQLKIQLSRATYDTWLNQAEPIHFDGDRQRGGTLFVSVPHHYCKDWIDRHLLTAMTKTFDDIANYSHKKGGRISEEMLFRIEIIVEGDPVPGIDCR